MHLRKASQANKASREWDTAEPECLVLVVLVLVLVLVLLLLLLLLLLNKTVPIGASRGRNCKSDSLHVVVRVLLIFQKNVRRVWRIDLASPTCCFCCLRCCKRPPKDSLSLVV